jgi:hypothetical protein
VAVEVDGWSHQTEQQARHDGRRNAWLTNNHIRVLRFPAADVLDDRRLMDVLATIEAACAPSVGFADSSPVNGGAYTGDRFLPRVTGEGDHAPGSGRRPARGQAPHGGRGAGSSSAKPETRTTKADGGRMDPPPFTGEVSPRSGDGGGADSFPAKMKRPIP